MQIIFDVLYKTCKKQIPAPASKTPQPVPTITKPDERQITIDRLQTELKEESQKSLTFKAEIEQLRSELEKLKGNNEQLTMEKEMLSAGLEQKSHETLETQEKLEEINTELLKTQAELNAERQKGKVEHIGIFEKLNIF